jgi:hypothetical protein
MEVYLVLPHGAEGNWCIYIYNVNTPISYNVNTPISYNVNTYLCINGDHFKFNLLFPMVIRNINMYIIREDNWKGVRLDMKLRLANIRS